MNSILNFINLYLMKHKRTYSFIEKVRHFILNNKIKISILLSALILALISINFSSANKIDEDVSRNVVKNILTEYSVSDKYIISANVVQFHNFDKFVIIKKGIDDPAIRYYPKFISLKIQDKIFIENKIPYNVYSANFADYIDYYLIRPLLWLFDLITSSFYGLISGIASIAIIGMYWKSKRKKKDYKVILPQQIKGNLSDIIGMVDIKKELIDFEGRYKEKSLYKEYGMDKPLNIMLGGPPGTGKTKIAGYIAKSLNLPIISCSAASLEDGYVGGGARSLEAIMKQARSLGKCIIFLDEAEILFKKRGSFNHHKHEDDTSNMILSMIDGISTIEGEEIIWIVASNFNDQSLQMDEAMLRRFQIKLDFRLPNKEERINILKMYIHKDKSKDKISDDIDYNHLSEMMSNLSPAHLQMIVEKSAMNCAKKRTKIDTKSLSQAFETVVMGISNRETTANVLEKRKLIGFHELGHFIIQFDYYKNKYGSEGFHAIKKNLDVLKISTESVAKFGALGFVLSKDEDVSLATREELEYKVKRLYGGVAAEKIFYGENLITTGSQNDIEKATKILNSMISGLSMYSDSKLNYSFLKSSDKDADLIKQIEKKSQELYEEAVNIVKGYQDLINYLNPILLENYVLSIDEIMDAIEKYYEKESEKLIE